MAGSQPPRQGDRLVIDRAGLDALLLALQRRGYCTVGPKVRDGAIVYDELASTAELPIGWTDEQDGGRYRLKRRDDPALFGYAVGPHSWKQFLHPATLRLSATTHDDGGPRVSADSSQPPRYAFIGVRSCELHGILIQDRVFTGGPRVDRGYQSRRAGIFVVALNCSHAGGTCFCVSMGTGPRVTAPFDLALTEVMDEAGHRFVVEVGSEVGGAVLHEVPHQSAESADTDAAERVVATTADHMGRAMETGGIKELLYANFEHPRWDDVAERCLTCGNCTMVCPTCFCFKVESVTDLAGPDDERVRSWDSCFTTDFTYTGGKPIRASARSRYRQWLTHKLAFWIDQYGTSGCVGCGRCITWCPVGIDITEEVRAIRQPPGAGGDAK
jgi:ferredoxin